jgi:hypothetical protein
MTYLLGVMLKPELGTAGAAGDAGDSRSAAKGRQVSLAGHCTGQIQGEPVAPSVVWQTRSSGATVTDKHMTYQTAALNVLLAVHSWALQSAVGSQHTGGVCVLKTQWYSTIISLASHVCACADVCTPCVHTCWYV